MDPFTHIKRIAVIGAGPAGLAAVKYLKAEHTFTTITVFEQRSSVGGVWNYAPAVPPSHQSDFTIPRTSPSSTVETPFHLPRGEAKDGDVDPIFPSPIYDDLETNIPHTLMNFSDKKFAEGTSLFPGFGVVREYLGEYAEDVAGFVRVGTQVCAVEKVQREGEGKVEWKVWYRDLRGKRDEGSGSGREMFDSVVVATGHYSDPYVPDIPGVREWREVFGGEVAHSKHYKNTRGYEGKKVVIIGNSASGIDISRQISTVASQVLVSSKTPSPSPSPYSPLNLTPVPEITFLDPSTRTLHFTDNTTHENIDSIIFCTGYLYSYPFLATLTPPVTTPSGARTANTYQHIFYHPDPTLAFLTLPQRIVPFPVAEAQAAYVARVFAGRLALPSRREMEAWEADRVAQTGESGFHGLGCPQDVEYINMLYGLSKSAEGEGRGRGKEPPFWGEEESWMREMFPEIKRRALGLGEERKRVRRLEDLGFVFRGEGRE